MSKLFQVLKAALARPWDRRVGIAFYCLFAAIAFVFIFLSREKVNSIQDLREVSGQITSYAFKDGSRSRYYRLHLDNYPSTFQIRADDIDLFDKAGFIDRVHRGDWITLGISKQSYESRLQAPGDVQLFSIQKDKAQFLRPMGVIAENNSPSTLIFGVLFFLASLGLFISRGIKAG